MASIVLRIKPRGVAKNSFVVSVGKSVARRAVDRNKIKRRIRVILRPFLKNQDETIVVIVRPEAAKKKFQELKEEILKSIARLEQKHG